MGNSISPETLAFLALLAAATPGGPLSPAALVAAGRVRITTLSQPKRRKLLRRMTHSQRALHLKRHGRP